MAARMQLSSATITSIQRKNIAGFLYLCSHKKRQVVVFDYDTLTTDDAKLFASLKEQELPKEEQPVALVLVENKKLTMDVSHEQFDYPIFTLLTKRHA